MATSEESRPAYQPSPEAIADSVNGTLSAQQPGFDMALAGADGKPATVPLAQAVADGASA
jgi:hypothetical protein